jgi:hypothetical protein
MKQTELAVNGVVDPDPDWIMIQWGRWIRIRIQMGKMTQKNRKFHHLNCCSLMRRTEDFNYSLHVLYGGLRISVMKTLNPDPS